jgi:hypothetical protein
MSVFKTTFSRALNIEASEHANIPYPNLITEALNSTDGTTTLTDAAATFITNNVKQGDIVIDTDGLRVTVTEVVSETELELNSVVGAICKIYQASSQTGLGNQGCYIYNTEDANIINVTTIGGDIVTFIKVPSGTVLPVQVLNVLQGDGIFVALW